jgi:hypothetical protein
VGHDEILAVVAGIGVAGIGIGAGVRAP